jgi:hypothetical protein
VPTGGPNGAVAVVANRAPLSLVDGPRCQSHLQHRKPQSELARADSVLRTRRPDLPVPHCGFCWDLGLYGGKDRGGPTTPQKHRRAHLPLFTTSSRHTQITVEAAAATRTRQKETMPRLSSWREFAAAVAHPGALFSGCVPSSCFWVEALDLTTPNARWRAVASPAHLREMWMHDRASLDGKVVVVANRDGLSYDPSARAISLSLSLSPASSPSITCARSLLPDDSRRRSAYGVGALGKPRLAGGETEG